LQEVLGLWHPNDSITISRIGTFFNNNKLGFAVTASSTPLVQAQIKDLGKVFGLWQKHFPDDSLPIVYRYYSQFSDYMTFAVPHDDKRAAVGYSAEMFAGDTFTAYKALELPRWYNRINSPAMVAPMLAMAGMNFYYDTFNTRSNMLGEMVYYGKLLYSTMKLSPHLQPWQICGLTESEWKWLLKEEANIWKHYLDANVLFSSTRSQYGRYFVEGDKTTGSGIPNDCPPMIGRWSGYRIIEAFMKKQSDLGLSELMRIKDPQIILNESAYKPK
jgi:hypothetical protein